MPGLFYSILFIEIFLMFLQLILNCLSLCCITFHSVNISQFICPSFFFLDTCPDPFPLIFKMSFIMMYLGSDFLCIYLTLCVESFWVGYVVWFLPSVLENSQWLSNTASDPFFPISVSGTQMICFLCSFLCLALLLSFSASVLVSSSDLYSALLTLCLTLSNPYFSYFKF